MKFYPLLLRRNINSKIYNKYLQHETDSTRTPGIVFFHAKRENAISEIFEKEGLSGKLKRTAEVNDKLNKMKKNRLNTKMKKIFIGFLTAMIMLPISLQAQKIAFLQSTVAPAAEGYVKVKTDRNNNNIIKIQIKNMVEIERLDPAMKTYVVWMVTDRDSTENIGRIQSSNNLNVSFEAISSYQPTKIFITAETNENTHAPSEKIVLSTGSFWE